ncbi:excinuclease ABC subunit UvrC [Jatrophihabitans sp.]|uniref:excinuclease ABC subunit UvrC n=1 Tax=Jatrophihabitans sp. TaxID=1932789 RepID=UPI0030C70FE3
MPDPSTYRPATGTIPTAPGVYKFRDPHGQVIYVGKAKSLRQRLNSYFADVAALHPRTAQMVTTAASVEWTVVGTEVEALQLEYTWIKEFDPRFNVRYRDDKSYPWMAVTLYEEFPRLQVMRGAKRKGVRYFGPYSHAWAIRETLDLLLRVFPARTCSAGVFKRAGQIGRPCLLGYIGKCSAPCVGRVTADEHRAIVDDFCDFMAGRTDALIKRLERRMGEASEELEFERAARLRDDLEALRRAMEKQAVVLGDGTGADVVAFAEDELEAAVQVFHVRGGRIRGQRGWVVDKLDDTSTGDLVEQFVTQFYGDDAEDGSDIPREVLVPELPDDTPALIEWLSQRRGTKVDLRVPQRGDKRTLAELVQRNASQSLSQHKLKRASDLTARSKALAELQEALELPSAPLRIECFDISHVQGTNVVASMVVFEDGLARKSEYRRFAMRTGVSAHTEPAQGAGDTDWIAEVIRRRFARYLDERLEAPEESLLFPNDSPGWDQVDQGGRPDTPPAAEAPASRPGIDPTTGRPKKFAYPPNLVVVDGGAPQVAAARAVLEELGLEDIALVGLAKRLEEVWLPGEQYATILPRTSEGLYLLQRVRDEAHRFAITFHREKRSKAMTTSTLDGIAGLGEIRRKTLMTRFGSLKRLRAASVEEISEVPGIGPRTAEAIVAALRAEAPAAPAVNVTTGEVLDADTRDGASAGEDGGVSAALSSASADRRGTT